MFGTGHTHPGIGNLRTRFTYNRAHHRSIYTSAPDGGAATQKQELMGEPARPPLYHMELNHWIEVVDKDHARYHAYHLTVAGAMGRDTPARIVAAGQRLDTMERVNGKWLLKTRDAAAND